jgi:hypothetical protein
VRGEDGLRPTGSKKEVAGILLFFYLLFLCGCRGKEVDITLPYSGDKLVLWGNLKAGNPLQLRVTKTFNPVGDVPADVAVRNAKVLVIKNGKEYLTLSPSSLEPGIYKADSLVEQGAEYKIKILHPAYPTAESEPVVVPRKLSQVAFERDRNVVGQINSSIRQDLLSISIGAQQEPLYYMLSFLAYFENHEYVSYWPAKDNVVAAEEDCFTWMNDEKGRRDAIFLFSSLCLPLSKNELKFYVASEVTFNENGGIYVTRPAQKMEMRIGIVSKEFYQYAKTLYDQPEGVDLLVLPPQMAMTNVKNGYGLIFASNDQNIELK